MSCSSWYPARQLLARYLSPGRPFHIGRPRAYFLIVVLLFSLRSDPEGSSLAPQSQEKAEAGQSFVEVGENTKLCEEPVEESV